MDLLLLAIFGWLMVGIVLAVLRLPWLDEDDPSDARLFVRLILAMLTWPLPGIRFARTQSADPS